MLLAWATVSSVSGAASGIQRLDVSFDDGSEGTAVNYTALVGEVAEGERVLLNATAVGLGLGTGGSHFVVAAVRSGEGIALDAPSGGHIMKMRYSPHQLDVVSVESQESSHHAAMRQATDLAGMPVVCCGLHSQVPLVAAAVKQADPSLRIAYVMTDEAALALPLSDVIRASVAGGLIDETISCGQSFGGGLEAVNLHSGLLAARHVALADVAIVAIGPGVVGTATPFGHGGVAQGEAVNAVAVLGGRPVACLRVSFADARERHRGVSHHTLSALSTIALAGASVAVPSLPEQFADAVDTALEEAGIWDRHARADASAGRTAPPDMHGVAVTTMGRGFADDPAFFAAAFAAGEVAARLATAAEA